MSPTPAKHHPAKPRCSKCDDTGFLRGKDLISRRCPCQTAIEISARIRRAGFPPQFAGADLSSYKATDQNRTAKLAARKYVDEFIPGVTSEGLLFSGSVGTGKTHLAIAIARELIELRGIEVRFIDLRELLDRLRSSYDNNSADSQARILKPILEANLVVIDELGAARPSDWVFETQELLIGSLYNLMRPVIVTTNLPNLEPGGGIEANAYARAARPETLGDRIGARMYSRLRQMCAPFTISGTDWRARK